MLGWAGHGDASPGEARRSEARQRNQNRRANGFPIPPRAPGPGNGWRGAIGGCGTVNGPAGRAIGGVPIAGAIGGAIGGRIGGIIGRTIGGAIGGAIGRAISGAIGRTTRATGATIVGRRIKPPPKARIEGAA